MTPTESDIRQTFKIDDVYGLTVQVNLTATESGVIVQSVLADSDRGFPERLRAAIGIALAEFDLSDAAQDWGRTRREREIELALEDAGDDARTHERREA
jgi:hypothetical protein